MAIWQKKSNRKPTGGLIRLHSKKQKSQMAGEPVKTTLGEMKIYSERVRGGSAKVRAKSAEKASVYNPKTKKISSAKILDVTENKANPHFIREKVITKGAIIKTSAGLARVTSRPGQHGVVNAVLVEETK